ncbi:MAG: sulfotransferase, partial [Desulfobacteraceae bacterium]|nr:sulfotransferase [Desulfobacteraceae bacterium]
YEVGLPRMWAAREELFRLTEKDTGPDPVRVKKEWGMRLNTDKPFLVEKSPSNSVRVRWLNHHFQPACFICIIRNGYAVAEGIRRKAEPKHLREGWPIEMAAYQWRRTYEVLESDSAYLNRFLYVRYEDLVGDPVKELNRIANFTGLKPFNNFDNLTELAIHERNEPIRDLNPDSISRLTPEDISSINSVAKDTLVRYGYSVIKGHEEKT